MREISPKNFPKPCSTPTMKLKYVGPPKPKNKNSKAISIISPEYEQINLILIIKKQILGKKKKKKGKIKVEEADEEFHNSSNNNTNDNNNNNNNNQSHPPYTTLMESSAFLFFNKVPLFFFCFSPQTHQLSPLSFASHLFHSPFWLFFFFFFFSLSLFPIDQRSSIAAVSLVLVFLIRNPVEQNSGKFFFFGKAQWKVKGAYFNGHGVLFLFMVVVCVLCFFITEICLVLEVVIEILCCYLISTKETTSSNMIQSRCIGCSYLETVSSIFWSSYFSSLYVVAFLILSFCFCY